MPKNERVENEDAAVAYLSAADAVLAAGAREAEQLARAGKGHAAVMVLQGSADAAAALQQESNKTSPGK